MCTCTDTTDTGTCCGNLTGLGVYDMVRVLLEEILQPRMVKGLQNDFHCRAHAGIAPVLNTCQWVREAKHARTDRNLLRLTLDYTIGNSLLCQLLCTIRIALYHVHSKTELKGVSKACPVLQCTISNATLIHYEETGLELIDKLLLISIWLLVKIVEADDCCVKVHDNIIVDILHLIICIRTYLEIGLQLSVRHRTVNISHFNSLEIE